MMQANDERIPMWRRFPAAHQFLRARLMDEIYPIAPAVAAWVEAAPDGTWLVSLSWPEVPFSGQARFSADELRQVYGRWSQWARGCALTIAEQLPV
ncbi:MAG TPA: hypothetical protein VH916_06400 [Dehalococcoidia bacterium]|jgi:hypothetical protein